MGTQPSAVFAIDAVDKVKRLVTFVVGPDIAPASAKALTGTDVFAAGSGVPIGKVASVEWRPGVDRTFVVAKISDATVWAKVKHTVYRAAQAKLYGDKLGSLNLIDAPHEDTTVLAKTALQGSSGSTSDALRKIATAIPSGNPSHGAVMSLASRLQHRSGLKKGNFGMVYCLSRADAVLQAYRQLRERSRPRRELKRVALRLADGLDKIDADLDRLQKHLAVPAEERVRRILDNPAFQAKQGIARRADGSLGFRDEIEREQFRAKHPSLFEHERRPA